MRHHGKNRAVLLLMLTATLFASGCGQAASESFVTGVRDLVSGVATSVIDAFFETRFQLEPEAEEDGNDLFIKI